MYVASNGGFIQATRRCWMYCPAARGSAVLPSTGRNHCGAISGGPGGCSIEICNGRHSASFCGPGCYHAAWPAHKVECRSKAAELEEAVQLKEVFPSS